MTTTDVSPEYRLGRRRVMRPFVAIVNIWTHAVAGESIVAHNVRLLAALTAVFSLPDLAQGIWMLAHASTIASRGYGGYLLALALLELFGAVLLAWRVPIGRTLVIAAALGFYLEAVLGLAGLNRAPLAVALFMACAPAEAWVIWFLRHQRVRAHVETWSRGDPEASAAPDYA